MNSAFETECVNTIRFLAADAVEKARSGHPGMPMGAAAMAYTLWHKHMKHNPANPRWVNRDRFILSAGHASTLLYAMLYLTGYDLTMDDLLAFRQWGSRTPGHPEHRLASGVEATTGPLGQGIGMAVGMAIAEAHLAAQFNRPDCSIVDHYTFVIASDGDLMEGVASEACSLAGHLRLGKLIVLYDDNKVSLAGSTSLSFTEDAGKRLKAFGWQVLRVKDGNSVKAIDAAIRRAKEEHERPSIIFIRTTIGCGAPHKEGSCEAHGAPLGSEELQLAKKNLGWPLESAFFVSDAVHAHFRQALTQGRHFENDWRKSYDRYAQMWRESAEEFDRRLAGKLPEKWDDDLASCLTDTKLIATRKTSEAVMQVLAARVPEFMGGSADLNPSTFTWLKGCGDFQSSEMPHDGVEGAVGDSWGYHGRNVHFGVREHAMGTIAAGMALHGGITPYTATFLAFSDYMRPPMRLAALMGIQVIYIFTHDSIALGEDGPTHQPIEQLMNLRAVPNLTLIRPADAAETVEAWRAAMLNKKGPTALIFTRQNVPVLERKELSPAEGLHRGGYILWQSSPEKPDIILIGTGSEVNIALEAGKTLASEGIRARIVSLPSWEIFDRQPPEYRENVLPSEVKARIAIEAGIKLGWERYVGLDGAIVGMESFGASAPAQVLYEKFGITKEHTVRLAKMLVKR